ncbi:MAG TPA: hypothetical protein VMZ53_34320 [Kofleriaceae bacterium]|nr:hypothetical protein [Kofleriaceae bacterium]
MGRLRVVLAFGLLAGAAGCPHRGTSAGGGGPAGFAITYPDAAHATAKTGKRFYAKPEGRCNYDDGREARWTMTGTHLASGELPPGLTIEDGVIGGVPTAAGVYHARIELRGVMCAGKAYDEQGVDIEITVK